jgi:crossover junction endodeoxyribonuclease RuvC
MPRYVGIDPSTKTGLVVLDEDGEIWEEREVAEDSLNGRSPKPEAMLALIRKVIALVEPGDRVAIEGFGFASQTGFLLGGIGWAIRLQLHIRGIPFVEVAPSALKKFSGAGGNCAKEELAVEVFARWGFRSKSNNITDAYVLAQIARALHEPVRLIKKQKEVISNLRGCFENGKRTVQREVRKNHAFKQKQGRA